MITAKWKDTIIAKSDDTVIIENNHYFPREDVNKDLLKESTNHTFCPWKGEASYYSIVLGDDVNEDAAWYYPEPKDAAKVIKNRIAFWKGVEVIEGNP